jgi:hypothetical protein
MQHRFTNCALLLLVLIFIGSLPACWGGREPEQPELSIQWSKIFEGRSIDSVQQTKDGGYILCGGKLLDENPHDAGVWLLKTDAGGNTIWDKTFSGESTVFGNSVQQTTDGGYIVCGDTLIKTDADGNELWKKVFEGWGYSVQQTRDSGFIICGRSEHHLRLTKTDADGNATWDKMFISQAIDEGNSVQQTTDGGYIVCGNTWAVQDYGGIDRPNVWLIKTDAEGNKLWDKTFGGTLYHSGHSVQQTTDGGYIICGTGDAEGAEYTLGVLLIKTDASGNKLWERVFENGHGSSVKQTTDGGFIICGTASFGISVVTQEHCWIIKTDADGNKLWDGVFGKGISYCRSIQQTADGGYITCGTIHRQESNRALLIKIPPEQ